MAMSLAAKAAWPLLWTECDDDGVFDWKPLVLKAKIFPADNIDMSSVLKEYETLQCVKSYELDGRMYGVVRNFIRFQRPKKPNSRNLVPSELRTFVGLNEDGTRPVRNQFGTGGENQCQMEDEGDKKEKKDKTADAAASSPKKYSFEGSIVKLTEKHFGEWVKAYSHLDLRGELVARDAWLGSDRATDGDRKNWFISTSKYLANRNMEARGKVEKTREFRTMSGMDGVI